jgi:SAM-dependent methyltransferase
MTSYEAFAAFYDAVQGERVEHASYLRGLIESRHPRARTVLELACGTGSILKQLAPHYEVTGLDLSEPMLAVAAEKLPGVRLIHGSMTRFELSERFDVVLCVYDSINHLLSFDEWEEVFDRAREHLADQGIFVFDINTEHRLGSLSQQPPWVRWFGDGHLLVLDVRDDGDGVVIWDIRVFEHLGDSGYRLHSEGIREISFPRDRVEQSLRERFARVSTHDERRTRPTPRSERLHFVCQR